ncbi:MAG: DNA-processing protein DprA [Planctomycetaceae bacterium]|jgi:DNA processing protein|nr:DNA-processing protein DprA [Planctomycetaceae bacterium]
MINDYSSELLDNILLSTVEGIGSRTYQQLLERFGSVAEILNASYRDLSGFEFLKPDTASRLASARKNFDPNVILELCQRDRIDIIPLHDSRYPEPLRTIHDPPPILYVKGKILPQDTFSIAVIGTRRNSAYGCRQADRLTTALCLNGFTIISGLALGIDGIAHRAALKSNTRTLAVLGSGHHRIYPPEHETLAEQIVQSGGAVLSEYPPLHQSAKWTFPQRNRIVSGLALGVLVVESPMRSGAMISARIAGEQGRDIFAVPGSIESTASHGCHQLIRDGAYLVESADDILNVLGPLRQKVFLFNMPQLSNPIHHPNEMSLNQMELTVLQHINMSPTPLNDIVTTSGLEEQQVVAALSVLEKKRIIRQISPVVFVRM